MLLEEFGTVYDLNPWFYGKNSRYVDNVMDPLSSQIGPADPSPRSFPSTPLPEWHEDYRIENSKKHFRPMVMFCVLYTVYRDET